MTITANNSLVDANHTTNDERTSAAKPEVRPMKTTRNPGSANTARGPSRHGGSAANGQWWKAWVLLSSLGTTVLGWMAFTTDKPPVESVVVSSQGPMPTQVAPVFRVTGVDEPRPLQPSARTLPTMPQKPVFQAPVTRTRRS